MAQEWLNGWPLPARQQSTVLIGTGVHCSGCGRFMGGASVVFPEDYRAPERLPDWPFAEEGCPVCNAPPPVPPEEVPGPVGEPCRVCAGTGRRPVRTLP
jgi:hypothetical protein